MKKDKEHMTKVVRVYLTHRQYDHALELAHNSMCRSVSEYGRKIMMQLPVTMKYRNRSADDAVEANIRLIAVLKGMSEHSSWSAEEKEWLKKEIMSLQDSTLKLFSLCLPK